MTGLLLPLEMILSGGKAGGSWLVERCATSSNVLQVLYNATTIGPTTPNLACRLTGGFFTSSDGLREGSALLARLVNMASHNGRLHNPFTTKDRLPKKKNDPNKQGFYC